MTATVNPATGEVAVELGGQTFRLRAAMRRVGELEKRLEVDGLAGVEQKLSRGSAGITLIALESLCVSENADQLGDVLYFDIAVAIDAIWKTLLFGLPDASSKKKRVNRTEETNGHQLPGQGSEPLHTAS